jgi:hypothetical protein
LSSQQSAASYQLSAELLAKFIVKQRLQYYFLQGPGGTGFPACAGAGSRLRLHYFFADLLTADYWLLSAYRSQLTA